MSDAGCVSQLALWEEYADEVEEQMRVLLADNALLQAALADVRSSLTHDRPPSAGASGARPGTWPPSKDFLLGNRQKARQNPAASQPLFALVL